MKFLVIFLLLASNAMAGGYRSRYGSNYSSNYCAKPAVQHVQHVQHKALVVNQVLFAVPHAYPGLYVSYVAPYDVAVPSQADIFEFHEGKAAKAKYQIYSDFKRVAEREREPDLVLNLSVGQREYVKEIDPCANKSQVVDEPEVADSDLTVDWYAASCKDCHSAENKHLGNNVAFGSFAALSDPKKAAELVLSGKMPKDTPISDDERWKIVEAIRKAAKH